MMDESVKKKSPSEELAEIATTILKEKGLILDGDASNTAMEISSGRMKEEDWRLLIEKAIDKEVAGE